MNNTSLNNPDKVISNYESGVSVSYTELDAGYTAPYEGVIFISLMCDANLTINGNTIGECGFNSYFACFPIPIYLKKGDVFKMSRYGGINFKSIVYFPL